MGDLIKRLKVAAEDFPIIEERPDKLLSEAADRIAELEAQKNPPHILTLMQQVDELKAELKVCHQIIKHGAQTGDEVAYIFDIEAGKESEDE